MFPVAVGEGPCEVAIVLGGHPINERQPRVVIGSECDGHNAQSRGFHRLLCFLVGRLGEAAFVEHDFLANLRTRLAPDAAEERAKTVVILLAPFLVRMMVALGALKTLA